MLRRFIGDCENLPRFGPFFDLEGAAFRWFILEPVSDVPLVRHWGSIGTKIPIWGTDKSLLFNFYFYLLLVKQNHMAT